MGRSQEEFPQLAAQGLKACEIRGDGNCLFNALSDQLYGDQNEHQEIRTNVIQFMRQNPEHFKPFITVGQGTRRNPKRKNAGTYSSQFSFETATKEQTERAWEEHLKLMAQGGTYGDNMEIQAFAKAYNYDVKIFLFDHAYYVRALHDGVVRPIAYIAYHTWEHYSSIRNINGPFTGLPEVREKELSAEETAQIKAATPKNAPIHDWMIRNIMTATPHLNLDEATIRKKLEENGGSLDITLSKLLDSGYLSSNPPSPGSYSQSGSSSIERDPDSDDDETYGPNKRQDRRMSRATKTSRKSNGLPTIVDPDLQAIPTIELTEPDSQTSSKLPSHTQLPSLSSQLPPLTHLPAKSDLPPPSQEVAEMMYGNAIAYKTKINGGDDWAPSDDDNDNDFKPEEDDDIGSSYSASSRSVSVSFGSTPPPRPTITLKFNTRTNKSMQKQQGPQKKKTAARDRKDLKKAAQKQARKESRRAANTTTTHPQLATSTTSINQNRNRNSPPMDQVIGMKTLYI